MNVQTGVVATIKESVQDAVQTIFMEYVTIMPQGHINKVNVV